MLETGQWTTPGQQANTSPHVPAFTTLKGLLDRDALAREQATDAARRARSTSELRIEEFRSLVGEFLSLQPHKTSQWVVEGLPVKPGLLGGGPSKTPPRIPDPLGLGEHVEDYWRHYRYQRTRGDRWYPSSVYSGAWLILVWTLPSVASFRDDDQDVAGYLWLHRNGTLVAHRSPLPVDGDHYFRVDPPNPRVRDGDMSSTTSPAVSVQAFWGPCHFGAFSMSDVNALLTDTRYSPKYFDAGNFSEQVGFMMLRHLRPGH